MSAEQVAAFFEKLDKDEGFRTRLEAAAEGKDPATQVRSVMSDAGFTFSVRDFREATKGLSNPDLSEKDLEGVVGGAVYTSTIYTLGSTYFSSGNLLSRGTKLGGILKGY